jgi:hypothetical protein
MTAWLIAAAAGLVAAALVYVPLRAPAPGWRVGLALLRAAAVALVLALVLDAPLGRARPARPAVFIDASLSMGREHGDLARVARDSARAADGDSLWLFGDTVRPHAGDAPAADAASRLRPVVERSMAGGRPAVVVTDGEVADSSALESLVSGSRVIVLARPARPDAAVASLDAPRAAVEGDSLDVTVTLLSGAQGAAAGTLSLMLDAATIGRWPVAAMSPWSERRVEMRVRAGAAGGVSFLRAVVASPGDAEPRNDTLTTPIELARAARAVIISTSPDEDVRFAMAVLRGALALPTHGYLRVAPGVWRNEGALTPVSETEVRAALRDAPVAIIHGDSMIFGPPRAATRGPLALMIPAEAEDGEWYPVATPASPLSGALAAIALDSLPPVAAGSPATGDWVALEARRGREAIRRTLVTGRDEPRRVVTVTGSGFWRWRFRGGSSSDAFAALWGGIFDWLAAERADRRGAVPERLQLRAGDVVRWRRGSAADSLVRMVVQSRAAAAAGPDTLVLRFGSGVSVLESQPLAAGLYDVLVPGGSTVLAVNASAELLPGRPRLQSGRVGSRTHVDEARRARNKPLFYIIILALLCVEWMARRRLGLR